MFVIRLLCASFVYYELSLRSNIIKNLWSLYWKMWKAIEIDIEDLKYCPLKIILLDLFLSLIFCFIITS